MATIHNDRVSSGQQVTTTRTNNTVDDANNTTDNIHTQYSPRLDSAMLHLISLGIPANTIHTKLSSDAGFSLNSGNFGTQLRFLVEQINVKLIPKTAQFTTAYLVSQAKVNDITKAGLVVTFIVDSKNSGILSTQTKIGTAFNANNVFEATNFSYDFSGDSLPANDFVSVYVMLDHNNAVGDSINIKEISLYLG